MIILLTLGYERTTDEIVDYFLYYNKKHLRINCDKLKENMNFTLDLLNNYTFISIDNKPLNLLDKNIIWYRRLTKKSTVDKIFNNGVDFNNVKNYYQFIFKEWGAFLKIFIKTLSKNSIWLDYPYEIDKLDVLYDAHNVGLNIPKTIITNSLSDYNDKNYITKPLRTSINFRYLDKVYTVYTILVKKIKTKFLPSLIQEKIDKRYEIRTYFLDGECYSMAIFSQSDNQTSVDFRKYNYKKPNRNIPYKLPKEIETKLRNLMKKLNLKTGSIDLIKGKDNIYYFLEVNPVGQFGMTSKPCNYNLEFKTFQKLIEYEKNL